MIKLCRANFDQAAAVNLKNLFVVVLAAKNKVLVLECHTATLVHVLVIKVELGRQFARSVNQPWRGYFRIVLIW